AGVTAAGQLRTPASPPEPTRHERDASRPRFTLRAAAFVLAVVLVLTGAVVAVAFFARGGYFVGADGDEVVIFKGRPGGLLWLEPTVVERTGVRMSELRPARVQDVRAGKEEPSVAEALRYVDNIRAEATPTTVVTTTTTAVGPAPTTAGPVPATGVP
ncbi:MAG: hypothetical protein M3Q48_03455, partial [Actinomycetota bacterium]|nr:hypothetical protein [Actinomycetota bacterium]